MQRVRIMCSKSVDHQKCLFLNPGGKRMMRKNGVGQETDIKAQQGFLQNNNWNVMETN